MEYYERLKDKRQTREHVDSSKGGSGGRGSSKLRDGPSRGKPKSKCRKEKYRVCIFCSAVNSSSVRNLYLGLCWASVFALCYVLRSLKRNSF